MLQLVFLPGYRHTGSHLQVFCVFYVLLGLAGWLQGGIVQRVSYKLHWTAVFGNIWNEQLRNKLHHIGESGFRSRHCFSSFSMPKYN